MIDLLARYAGALSSIVSALLGGGVVAAYRTWKKQNRKDKAQQQDLDRLRERVQQLEADKKAQDRRIDELEARLEEWAENQHYTPPSERRRQEREAREHKLSKIADKPKISGT
jgi:membrane protein involved in colicin uptake